VKTTNKFNLPTPVALALSQEHYTRGESDRSVTQLIDNPRPQILNRTHYSELEEDVTDRLWSVFGTAVHNIFESHADVEYLAEERLFADVNGWTISGAIDVQKSNEDGTIQVVDYKVTSVWKIIYSVMKGVPDRNWQLQQNFYAWLVETVKDVKVDKLTIIAVLRDWKESDKDRKGSDYPESPIMAIDLPLWDFETRDNYVKDRVEFHQSAEFSHMTGEELPLCEDDERWLKAPQFAVKKPRNKRAERVFETQEEAEAFLDNKSGMLIEERKSEPIRCMRYCHAAPYCSQHKEYLDGR
tara:strand:+ start:12415 stop:13308 length:894 start_codon:yes stop_codon:yes gene_type:complete